MSDELPPPSVPVRVRGTRAWTWPNKSVMERLRAAANERQRLKKLARKQRKKKKAETKRQRGRR